MTSDQRHLLISILARIDALFTPFRWRGMESLPVAAAIQEKRNQHAKSGLPVVGGGSAANRKSHERKLAELRGLGLLQIIGGRGKRAGVKLTERGDDFARWMAPTNTAGESWPWLEKVAELTDTGATNSGHVLEADLLGIQYSTLRDSRPLTDLEDFMLPLLCRGLLTSQGDTEGRIGYAITTAGRRALAADKPDPLQDVPPYDPELGQEFIELYQAALNERDGWKSDKPSHVCVPLSAGRWAGEVARS